MRLMFGWSGAAQDDNEPVNKTSVVNKGFNKQTNHNTL